MVSLRLVEFDARGRERRVVVLRPDTPSGVTDEVACTSFDLGYPEVNAASYSQIEGNGVVDLTRFHGASTVTVDLVLLGPEKVGLFDKLRAMCHPYKRVYLYVSRPEWDSERRLRLRANSFSFISDRASATRWRVNLSWSNPTGRMEAVDLTTVEFSLRTTEDPDPTEPPVIPPDPDPVTGGSGYGSKLYSSGLYGYSPAPMGLMGISGPPGLMMARDPSTGAPRLFSLGDDLAELAESTGYSRGAYSSGYYGSDYGGTGPGDAILLVKGTAPVHFTAKVIGPCKDPTLTFDSIGTSVYLKGLIIPEGEFLYINSAARQMLMNEKIDKSVYPNLSLSVADGWNGWPYLLEGRNDISFGASEKGEASKVEITFRDEWI